MRVLIIPEDVRLDQYMVKPLFQSMMKELGRPRARVEVCQNPRFQGVSQVLDWGRMEPVLKQYRPIVDLVVICVDRDGKPGRDVVLRNLEDQSRELFAGTSKTVFAVNAHQEMEVWLLAGCQDLPKDWSWNVVREEPDPKEKYFEPYAEGRGVLDGPGQGRQRLGVEAAKQYGRIRQLCPEIKELEERIGDWMGGKMG